MAGDCPDTVHPSLWRQSQLTANQGLYEVTEGIYQVRGFDLSNMTLVEGDTGVIVIDPLISAEMAAAALALYRAHRGERPVTAVIYTHAHLDHFGGVLGVVDADTDVPIVAPEHFLEHAVSENVYAGVAMLRRGMYYTGDRLAGSPTGTRRHRARAPAGRTGTVGLIAPTLDITHTGQEETLDGVRIVFQMTPGTECPGRDELPLPRQARAVPGRERHPQPAQPADPARRRRSATRAIWSRYLNEAIELFADDTDVAFASHHWPTWGTDDIVSLPDRAARPVRVPARPDAAADQPGLRRQRDRRELIEMPPALDAAWHTHGYYGSVSHNVKAIYQRYLGWYDGNPAHLWQHPPRGGGRALRRASSAASTHAVAKAQEFADAGDLRFAAELASHAVFADPDHDGRQGRCSPTCSPRLGYGAESAHLAQLLPDRRPGAARHGVDADGQLGRAWRPR